MQAIQTHFLGPTDQRDSRIVAKCQSARIVVPWDDSRDVPNNHANAAQILAVQLGWTKSTHGAMYGGALPNETGYAFVFTKNPLYCFAPDVL
jgi:hypothetical protein